MSIPVFQPFLSNSELQACKEALDCKYLGMGSFVGELENKLADFLNLKNNKNLLLFSTGHAALHLALMSLNISNGLQHNYKDALVLLGLISTYSLIFDKWISSNDEDFSTIMKVADEYLNNAEEVGLNFRVI